MELDIYHIRVISAASLNRINFIIWDQDLKSLDSKVNQAISQYGIDKVGVYFVAFDEIAPIFIQAQNHPTLSKVKWYGSDGSALNNKLIRNVEAASICSKNRIFQLRFMELKMIMMKGLNI